MQYEVTIYKDYEKRQETRSHTEQISAGNPRLAVAKALRLINMQSWRLGQWSGKAGQITIEYRKL